MQILIVDDETLFREGLRALMESLDPRAKIQAVADCNEALAALQGTQFDVVLLDLNLPPLSHYEALDLLHAKAPEATIVALSGTRNPDAMRECVERGAAGFIVKTSSPRTLMNALRIVLAGGVYLPSEALAKHRTGPGHVIGPTATGARATLTLRQLEVLGLVALGHQTSQIATRLGIAEGTVKEHLESIFRALGVRTRAHAVFVAVRSGLIPLA